MESCISCLLVNTFKEEQEPDATRHINICSKKMIQQIKIIFIKQGDRPVPAFFI